jgi:hypothetical protein
VWALQSGFWWGPISEEESEEEIRCCKELLVRDNNMTSASSLQPKVFRLLLGWTGLEAEEEESPFEEDKEKVSWEPLSMSSLPSLSSSPLSTSPLSLPPKMASSTVLTSKDEEYLQPPHLLWKCGHGFQWWLKVTQSAMKPYRRISEAVQTGITVAGNQVHLLQTATLHSFQI